MLFDDDKEEQLRACIDRLLLARVERQSANEKHAAARDAITDLFVGGGEIRKGAALAVKHGLQLAELDDREYGQYRVARQAILAALKIEATGDLLEE